MEYAPRLTRWHHARSFDWLFAMLARYALLALCAVFTAAGCGRQYIQSDIYDAELKVRNTEDNAEITALMVEYERALDALDLEAIEAIISADYYENAGTTDTTRDDYGVEGLSDMMELLSEHVDEIRFAVSIREIIVTDELAEVLFDYEVRALYSVADEQRWENERDVNRIQLLREDAGWRIISGL